MLLAGLLFRELDVHGEPFIGANSATLVTFSSYILSEKHGPSLQRASLTIAALQFDGAAQENHESSPWGRVGIHVVRVAEVGKVQPRRTHLF